VNDGLHSELWLANCERYAVNHAVQILVDIVQILVDVVWILVGVVVQSR
jgi:hypothetical protein